MEESGAIIVKNLLEKIENEIEKIKTEFNDEMIKRLHLESLACRSENPFWVMSQYLSKNLNSLLNDNNLEKVFADFLLLSIQKKDKLPIKKLRVLILMLEKPINSFEIWAKEKGFLFDPYWFYFKEKHESLLQFKSDDFLNEYSNWSKDLFVCHNEYSYHYNYANEIMSFFSMPGLGRLKSQEIDKLFREKHLFTLYEAANFNNNKFYYSNNLKKAQSYLVKLGLLYFNKKEDEYLITLFGQHIVNCTIHFDENQTNFNPKFIDIEPALSFKINRPLARLLRDNFQISNPEKIVEYCNIIREFMNVCSLSEIKVGHKIASYRTGLPNLSKPKYSLQK